MALSPGKFNFEAAAQGRCAEGKTPLNALTGVLQASEKFRA